MAKTSMKHPISGWLYQVDPSGLVRVSDPESDRFGLFDSDGVWFEGEIRDIDLQIVGWMGRTAEARRLREAAGSADVPMETHDSTREG